MIPADKIAEYVRRIRQELRLLRVDCAVRVEGKKDTDAWFWSERLKKYCPKRRLKSINIQICRLKIQQASKMFFNLKNLLPKILSFAWTATTIIC